MKKRVVFVAGLSLVLPLLVGCDSEKSTGPAAKTVFVTLTAKPVTTLPVIDGDASDAAWKSAAGASMAVLTMKAVYTNDEIAFLMTWLDRDMSINSAGTWNYNPASGAWTQTGAGGKWESFSGSRHPEWLDVSFDISSQIKTQGCSAFCHASPTGSGAMHHNTAKLGEKVDTWLLLAKHGFGSTGLQDMGWLVGVDGATQAGTLVFDPIDTLDSHQPLVGKATFVGYAEDKFMTSLDDPAWPKTTRPADLYCIKCHADKNVIEWSKTENRTYGDDGDIPYAPNWNATYSAPIYMEKAPVNFADAMILTQAEIESGEAVAVAGLTAAQRSEYWARYAGVNAVVPQLVLKRPTGSQADVRVAATWDNGRWTVEFKRKLVTGYADDVQFSDLAKDYYYTISLTSHQGLIGPLGNPALLKFGT